MNTFYYVTVQNIGEIVKEQILSVSKSWILNMAMYWYNLLSATAIQLDDALIWITLFPGRDARVKCLFFRSTYINSRYPEILVKRKRTTLKQIKNQTHQKYTVTTNIQCNSFYRCLKNIMIYFPTLNTPSQLFVVFILTMKL